MTGKDTGIQVTMEKNPDGPVRSAPDIRFLKGKKGQIPSPAGLTQGGGGIFCVQISGDRKNQGNNILLGKAVCPQKLIIKGSHLSGNIFLLIEAPGRTPEGKNFFIRHTFPPAAAIINDTTRLTAAPKTPRQRYAPVIRIWRSRKLRNIRGRQEPIPHTEHILSISPRPRERRSKNIWVLSVKPCRVPAAYRKSEKRQKKRKKSVIPLNNKNKVDLFSPVSI
jgi:hypothetical protein